MMSPSPSFTLSSVTVAVDKATSELLLNPDWTLNIAICDSVNSHPWQTKDAVKAVKRRLQHKSAKVQMLALTLLEAMVKNCGEYVHVQIAEKHVLGEMVKIVKKKGDIDARNKILVLLDTWHEAFGGSGCKYHHYKWACEELRRSGVKFPERSRETALMLKKPNACPSLMESAAANLQPRGSFRSLDETMATEIETLSSSGLQSMRNVMDLVNDMVQAVNPGDRLALKGEVIVDLVDQCRSNQKKLIQMLTTTADDEVLARGLELNDRMQVVLARHDALASGIPLPLQAANLGSKPADTSKNPGEVRETNPNAKTSAGPESLVSSKKSETDEEVDEDDFAQLARRHAQPRRIPSKMNFGEESEDALLIGNNKTSDEQGTECKELALPDSAASLRSKEEQDIIDLLSLTLSTTTLASHQPQNHPHLSTSSPDPNIHQTPFSAGTQDQMFLNSYVVPWAQQPPLSTNYSLQDPHLPSQPQLQQQPQFQPLGPPHFQRSQLSYQHPPLPWVDRLGSFSNTNNNIPWNQRASTGSSYAPEQREKQLHYSNSFPIRGSNTGAGETRLTSRNTMNGVRGTVHKPYIPPYRLFEDLNVFRHADGRVKVASNASPGLQANHGRK